MSAAGKSTITASLVTGGYRAIDLDSDTWSHWVVAADDAPGTPVEAGRDWVWREDRVAALLADDAADVVVVSGCSPNQGQFYPLFDAIVLLSAPPEVVAQRLATRTGNDYGKGPGEAARVLDLIREVEPILRAGATHEIDSSGAPDDVLAAVIRIVDPP
jgi:shikimate kinase